MLATHCRSIGNQCLLKDIHAYAQDKPLFFTDKLSRLSIDQTGVNN